MKTLQEKYDDLYLENQALKIELENLRNDFIQHLKNTVLACDEMNRQLELVRQALYTP